MPEQNRLRVSIVVNVVSLIVLLLSPFLASGDWTWGPGWLYTGSMILYALISRIIAIRLHPGFARERATASAMHDTKGWDRTGADPVHGPRDSDLLSACSAHSCYNELRLAAFQRRRSPDGIAGTRGTRSFEI